MYQTSDLSRAECYWSYKALMRENENICSKIDLKNSSAIQNVFFYFVIANT